MHLFALAPGSGRHRAWSQVRGGAHLSSVRGACADHLEPETMLEEVVEGTRALTGARYGVIITVDESGGSREFVIKYLDRGAPHYAGVVTHSLPE